jgi:hypothetical protein
MHALWDLIFDVDAIVAGHPTMIDREAVERMVAEDQRQQELLMIDPGIVVAERNRRKGFSD